MKKVVLEIELDAVTPYEAAVTLETLLRSNSRFQYYVQDENGKIFSVDLEEDDEDNNIIDSDVDVVVEIDDYKPLIKSNG